MFLARFLEILKRVVSRRKANETILAAEDQLRAEFKVYYHSFKLLLAANNKALEIMSDMERTLRGYQPYSMNYIRANCTAIGISVFKIIKSISMLAPNKYLELFERFHLLQKAITKILDEGRHAKGNKLVLNLEEVDREKADQVGAKMAILGELKNRLRLPVPPGFAISALACRRFFEHNALYKQRSIVASS
jgi:pyruvate,water dikinase